MGSEPTVVIKPFATQHPRDLYATSRYMSDIQHESHKVPHDEQGPMSGSINCQSVNRAGCLKEISTLLKLYGNPRSSQAAEHNAISYPSGIRPTRAQIERDIRIDMKKRGMDDHLVIWDAHDNTDHFHVHYLLCRVVPSPDNRGKFRLADNGIVKVTREDRKRNRVRTRTDEAACRQAAIAEINTFYGLSSSGLTHDANGNPRPRTKAKDTHSDKTRAGERKTGKKSKERQLSAIIKEVFDLAASEAAISPKISFWSIADREFSSRAIEMTIKTQDGKPIGGYVTGPDNRKCSFSKAGKEYSVPALVKRFGPPTIADQAHHIDCDFEPFEYRPHDLTPQEAKKRLLPVFREAAEGADWTKLIEGVQQQGMHLARSGGGLVVLYNDGRDVIKCSDISNKFSLSRLEKILGPCPIPKAAPAQPSARDTLIQDALGIIAPNVRRTCGLYHIRPELERAGIKIERKTFIKSDGERVRYDALTRAGISISFSALGKDPDGTPYSLHRIKKLDEINPTARAANWFAHVEAQAEISRQRREAYQAEAPARKEQKSSNLSMLAMCAHMVKFFKKESKDAQTNGTEAYQGERVGEDVSREQSLFTM